jgi:hypothetical protein
MPDGWTPPPPGGEPRQNRAIAAKMVYPDLTYREALLLGGYEDEELDVVKNPKHMWRTGERSFVSSSVTTTANVFLFRVCSTFLLTVFIMSFFAFALPQCKSRCLLQE